MYSVRLMGGISGSEKDRVIRKFSVWISDSDIRRFQLSANLNIRAWPLRLFDVRLGLGVLELGLSINFSPVFRELPVSNYEIF
uniref:Uncharacterized protein n=1 Tax=Meloidogyne enterolobii TaxID=390850 RepID=A0A6V7UD77_MELEN|nr:unnamed protein product [Meloidogyne enterolobii]